MKKIVVIGGGFAGSFVAKKLEKEFDLTLIDLKNYFEFTPGVLRSIVEPSHIKKIQVLHNDYLKKSKIIVGKVKKLEGDYVFVNNKKINFDYLVIASGSSYNPPFKDKNILVASRTSEIFSYYEKLKNANKILIIGGGVVGVELAGEIIWKYKGKKKIIIVHAEEKLTQRLNEKVSKYIYNYFLKNNVSIFLNERVIKKRKGFYYTDKGREIKADLVFLCTGIKPNSEFFTEFSNKSDKKLFLKVNEFLQLEGKKNIFVAGDVNDIKIEKTAQNAIKQAMVVVKNIRALEKQKRLVDYKPKSTPMVISLGKFNGVFVHKNFNIYGAIPALMKCLIEKFNMFVLKI